MCVCVCLCVFMTAATTEAPVTSPLRTFTMYTMPTTTVVCHRGESVGIHGGHAFTEDGPSAPMK